MAADEHEILVGFVVMTDKSIEDAGLWLQERLLAAGFPEQPADEDSVTHVNSFWIAEDFKTEIDPGLEGMRSAVFVPEPLTQEQAANILEQAAILAALGGNPEEVLAHAN